MPCVEGRGRRLTEPHVNDRGETTWPDGSIVVRSTTWPELWVGIPPTGLGEGPINYHPAAADAAAYLERLGVGPGRKE